MATVRAELAKMWPLFGLTIRTPRLELRLPAECDIVRLIKVARRGVHAPGWVPMGRWTYVPSPEFERSAFQRHCRLRAEWKPEEWNLHMAVYVDGRPIGCQDLMAGNFGPCRTANTGSWLGYEFQGNGYGTEMRQAIVWFAFEVLGAHTLWSDYWHDNAQSAGVSRKLGYEVVFEATRLRDKPDSEERYPDVTPQVRLKPDHWNRPEYDITVEGFEPCREMFGL